MTERWVFAGSMGLLTGGILFVPTYFGIMAPLQFIAWTPLLIAVSFTNYRNLPLTGICMAISYVCIQSTVNSISPLVTLALLAHMAVLMILFCFLARPLLLCPSLIGCFAVGALAAVVDWINFTVLPIWGIAQSWARPWSFCPFVVQFISLTGLAFVSFVTVSVQAMFLYAVRKSGQKHRVIVALTIMGVILISINTLLWNLPSENAMRVAAMGWTPETYHKYDSYGDWFSGFFARNVTEASEMGAELIVTPEKGFVFGGQDIDKWRAPFQELARRNGITMVIGYYHSPKDENRLMFISSEGKLMGEYVKTHLTPVENSVAGRGDAVMVDINENCIGGVICHDDNYTSLTRKHGMAPVSVLAVPTNDWLSVVYAHFQSSRCRSIESSMAVVRGGGISAIISPRGEMIASRNHYSEGAGVVTGFVSVAPRKTLFDRFGHWPVPIMAVFSLLVLIRTWIMKRRS